MIQTATDNSTTRWRRPVTLLSIALTALLAAAACAPSGDDAKAAEEADTAQSYTVRGEVTAAPGQEGLKENQVRIRHEPVPEFVGFDGEVVGMSSMNMPFPAADSVDLGDLAVGDKIEFAFEVNWEGSPGYRIIRIKKLPPDTELDFGHKHELPGEKDIAETEPTPP